MSKHGPDGTAAESRSARTAWETYIPYDSPYEEQVDGIERVRAAALGSGYSLMEGACGTGKTLISLAAGISLVRDPSTRYERVMCSTSVKQQLDAFIDDMESINANLPADIEPVRGLTLVGKPDVCSLVDAGTVSKYGIYGRCSELRDPIWRAISAAESDANETKTSVLEDLVGDKRTAPNAEWPTAISGRGWTAPIRDEDLSSGGGTADGKADRDGDGDDIGDYCAFYAQHLLHDERDRAPISLDGMMSGDDVLAAASENGTCPHAALGAMMETAEVVIGNYNHVFDRRTRNFTEALVGEGTFLVIDEAHTVEERVRDLLEREVTLNELVRSAEEAEAMVRLLDSTEPDLTDIRRALKSELRREGVSRDAVARFGHVVAETAKWLAREANDRTPLDETVDGGDDTVHESLRDADERMDALREWMEDGEHVRTCRSARTVGEAMASARSAAARADADYPRDRTYSTATGTLLSAWSTRQVTDNFQTVAFETPERGRGPDRYDGTAVDLGEVGEWRHDLEPKLVIRNCIPREHIAEELEKFGGGLLMSATLAPLDVYERVTGVDDIVDGGDTGRGAARAENGSGDRPGESGTDGTANDPSASNRIVYGLNFPRENRTSLAVDLPRFTSGNRKRPDDPEGEATRSQYARVLRDVCGNIDGNVLVAMPSYSEGRWAADALRGEWGRLDPAMQRMMRETVDKEILVDESSDNETTNALKSRFFGGQPKVLITSLRGTLTEGVDYDGSKLRGCVVCGVPMRQIGTDYPEAIREAYDRAFPGNGFEFAFAVPAVRKTRQALGRVVRSPEEVGVRVLADERYARTSVWGSIREHIPDHAREEYDPVSADEVRERVLNSPVGRDTEP